MKTLRALFWGVVVGALVGYLFAPRQTDVMRASSGARSAQRSVGGTQTLTRGRSTAAAGAFVGNTHTRVYHQASDTNLPAEENRAYFESAEAAEAAGYRPAGNLSAAM